MVEQHFCLRWNNYRTNITAEFETLREGEHFVDVTLACDGKQLKAHKVVLSACSPYFKELLQGNPCSHPIIILRDVAYIHMRSLLEFMYAGEVNISQAHLGSFLHTAEALKIRGLAESSEERKEYTRGCNSQSPLTALKTSLGNFSGISLGSLGPSILERPLLPQLLPHSVGDSSSNSQAINQLVPPSLSLPSTSYCSPPLSSSSALAATTGSIPSPNKSPHRELHSQGPIPLTINTNSNELSYRIKGEISEHKESTSPVSLPPHKRMRLESKIATTQESFKSSGEDSFHEHKQNGCSFISNNSSVSPLDTVTSKCATSNTVVTEEALDAIPKIEPIDQPVSDTDGSVGWPEEGESCTGGAGRDSYTPPDFHSSNPPNASSLLSGADSENTSHLLQALSSESHLPGPSSYLDGERLFHNEEPNSDTRHDSMRERMSTSPPLPPSSLPHSCQLCGKLISCRRNLWKHMERVHFTNPAVRCSLCAKMFKNKYALKDHQRIYHGGLSEPSQVPPPHSSSLLSRILQDSRMHQPPPRHQDLPSITQTPHIPTATTHHHSSFIRRQPEEKDHPGVGGTSFSNMSSHLPHSLAPPSMGGSHSQSLHNHPPEVHYPLINRSLLTELHHMVTKAE